MKKKLIFMPMVIFLCFIFAMTALFVITPKTNYSPSEKRYLADFPETNLQTVTSGEFETGFESYLADHFPFRNMWVGLNAYYNLFIGNNGNDGVYNCADGYLINEPVKKENRVKTNLNTVCNFSKNIDVKTTVMLVPSTGYVLEDKLPAMHRNYLDDELFESAGSILKNAGIGFVDLRESFKNDQSKLYYRTDHHWTSFGARAGYEKLCEYFRIKPSKRSDFKIKTYHGFYGTTYSTSGFWLTEPDDISVWYNKTYKDGDVRVRITEGKESKVYDGMYFTDHLKEDDKYPVFLDGNHALEKIVNKNVKDGKLLIIKDSFCHTLAPFLADNFRTVTMVDLRYYKNSVSELVKKGRYDKVLVLYGIDNLATDTDLVWLK